jgi:uncharacterized protein
MGNGKVIVLAVVVFTLLSTSCFALDKLTGFVNDEANVISPEYEAYLNQVLLELKENTSVEFAIATVRTLDGVPIEDVSLALAHNVLGDKSKDNGVLILLAVEDREYRIEVGYGLEPVIPASLAGRIGRNYMQPHFAENNFEEGLLQGAIAIISVIHGDESLETQAEEKKVAYNATLIFIFIILIMFIVFSAVSAYHDNKNYPKEVAKNSRHDKDFEAAALASILFGRRGRGGGGFSGGGGFGGFGGGGFGGGGFSGKF